MRGHLHSLAARHPHFHLHLCFSQPLAHEQVKQDFQHHGHVDITLLRLALALKAYQFYLCGPRTMIESLVAGLYAWEVPEQHIHYESFGPASVRRPVAKESALTVSTRPSAPSTVVFSRSGKTVLWDERAESLLQFAEQHSIEVASGCRAGMCGACQTEIQSGEVEYTKSPEVALPTGHCLLCVSRPHGDVTLLA